jgi:hypothetical protein
VLVEDGVEFDRADDELAAAGDRNEMSPRTVANCPYTALVCVRL